MVGGADFGERNVVYAERHTEHFLQFLTDTDFVCKACVVGHRKGAAIIRPIAQMGHVVVIGIAIDGLNHGVQTLKVGECEVVYKLYGIERLQVCGFIRVEFLDLTGAPNFGIAFEVVVDVLCNLRVSLCLFQPDVVEHAVAQILHGASLQNLAVVHITFHKCIAGFRKFDFALDFFLHHEAVLVAQAFDELDAFFA